MQSVDRISDNNIITLAKGDNFTYNYYVNSRTQICPERYILQENDKLYFALCEPNQPYEEALFIKEYTDENLNADGDVIIKFVPEDTKFLLPGKYYYTIKLDRWNAYEDAYEIYTLQERTLFYIIE